MNNDNPGGMDTQDQTGPVGLSRGSTVGRYLVVGLIGKGGAGEVYAAYDPELDRKIALKLLRTNTNAGIDPSEGRARLLREAQAIARLSDPNVVVVFDVGTFGDRVFLAMEFVDGTTLAYWRQSKSRGWREVVATFSAAGRGLASAHKAGLVHRDFKPDNVMIGRDGKVHVMDFGLARTIDQVPAEPAAAGVGRSKSTPTVMSAELAAPTVVSIATEILPVSEAPAAPAAPAASVAPNQGMVAGPSAAHAEFLSSPGLDEMTRDLSVDAFGLRASPATSALNSPLTETGAMMGTPAYMAPEQFKGAATDARTDQFSFCVALYEALYGQRPFDGRNIHDLTASVMKGRVRDAPPGARVPSWLRRVVLRGLRVERAERHPSMDALLATLARDPMRARKRWAAGASVVGLIALLAVGLVRSDRRMRMRCLGDDAKLAGIWEVPDGKGLSPRKKAIRKAFLATGKGYAGSSFTVVMTALDKYVSAWNAMHRDACEATNIRGEQSAEVLDLRMSCLQDRFSEVRALAAVFSDATGDVVSKSVGATQSLRPIEQCADIATLRAVVRPPDDPAVRSAVEGVRSDLADLKALLNAGKYRKAADQIGKVMAAAQQTHYDPVIAEALLQSASFYTERGESSKSETAYEQAIWMADASRHDEVVVEAAAQLIYVVGYLQDRYVEGERWARQASAALRRLGPGHDVVAGWRANNLGVMYEKQGRFADSLTENLNAVALKSRALGSQHFDVGISYCNVALALFRLGRVDEAVARNDQALTILRAALGPEHPRVAVALTNGAEFLNAGGRRTEARVVATQAIAIWEREAGADGAFLGYPLTTIGESYIEEGRPELAIPYLERALRIREAKHPEADLLGETRFALARAFWESNVALDRAMALAERARSDYDKSRVAEKQKADIDGWIDLHSLRIHRAIVR